MGIMCKVADLRFCRSARLSPVGNIEGKARFCPLLDKTCEHFFCTRPLKIAACQKKKCLQVVQRKKLYLHIVYRLREERAEYGNQQS